MCAYRVYKVCTAIPHYKKYTHKLENVGVLFEDCKIMNAEAVLRRKEILQQQSEDFEGFSTVFLGR